MNKPTECKHKTWPEKVYIDERGYSHMDAFYDQRRQWQTYIRADLASSLPDDLIEQVLAALRIGEGKVGWSVRQTGNITSPALEKIHAAITALETLKEQG